MEKFTDGLWHSVSVDVMGSQGSTAGQVVVNVDGRPDISRRELSFTSGSDFFIGGMFVFSW